MGQLAQWPLSNSTRFIFETRMGLLANIWPQPRGPHTSVNCGAYNAGISGHPGGSTPGDPWAFVKSALTNAF